MATKKVINMKEELDAAKFPTSKQLIPLAKIFDKQKESISVA